MRRSAFAAALALVVPAAGAACGSPPGAVGDAAPPDAAAIDAAPPDAVPDAPVPLRGPVLVLDDLHIAGLAEDPHAFSLLGQAVNPQLEMQIQNGTLLVALELLDLDDPSGQSDPALRVGLYNLTDSDGDPGNNFDPDAPEFFRAGPGAFGMSGEPNVIFPTAAITQGALHAEGLDSLMVPGGLPLPLRQAELDGTLNPTQDEQGIRTLTSGRLRGAVPAQLLALAPNVTGGMCPGMTMLDVLALGCGFIAVQPDVDLDGDGLERFYDTMGADADAGMNDGRIDRCVDGDGAEVTGVDCPSDPRFADGYRLILVIHGVRGFVLE